MRAALYTRVSTPDQSVDSQLLDLRAHAERLGYGVVREYSDVGVSGAKQKRPALDDLMRAASRREFDAVLVWRFDRFARSTRHLIDALHEFKRRGIAFVSVTENIDTSTPMGEAMFTIVGAIAQLERDIIRERVKAGQRAARERGSKIGRPRGSDYGEKELEECRRLRRLGRTIRTISEATGVPRSTVARACSR